MVYHDTNIGIFNEKTTLFVLFAFFAKLFIPLPREKNRQPMDFKDNLLELSARVAKLRNQIATEEAAKTAFVLPFIKVLGYDFTDPTEVEPEHTCDVGTKKGEKIDYAILKDGAPVLLIECKHSSQNLDYCGNQLFRYFGTSKAKYAVLTDGIQYRFFSDLESENVMDKTPFLEIDMTNLKDSQIEELKKFHKSYFHRRFEVYKRLSQTHSRRHK